MNKWLTLFLIVCALSLATSCSISEAQVEKPLIPLNSQKHSITSDSNSVQSNDFVLRMISTKEEYIVGEKVELYAELEYVGQHPEITITHAASPIGITLHENNSNIGFGYVMDQPLVTTVIQKEYAFQQEYKFTGLSFDDSKKEYKELYSQLADGHFPKGEYVMTAIARFNDITNDQKDEYEMQVTTSFKVVE